MSHATCGVLPCTAAKAIGISIFDGAVRARRVLGLAGLAELLVELHQRGGLQGLRGGGGCSSGQPASASPWALCRKAVRSACASAAPELSTTMRAPSARATLAIWAWPLSGTPGGRLPLEMTQAGAGESCGCGRATPPSALRSMTPSPTCRSAGRTRCAPPGAAGSAPTCSTTAARPGRQPMATRLPAASSARTCPAGHRSQSRTAGRRPVPSRSVKGRAAHCADRRVPSGGAPCRALDRTPHAPGSPIERLCAQKGGSYALLRCTAPSRVAKFGVIPRFCSRRR